MQVVFGGSFDPFHLGHFQMLQQCADQLSPETIRILPCYQQALKSHQALDSKHRLSMLELIAKQLNDDSEVNTIVDDFEIKQNGTNYSIDTLKHLQNSIKQPIVFMMGEDSILNIKKWKHWQDILNYCHIAVVKRNGDQKNNDLKESLPSDWQKNWLDTLDFKHKIHNTQFGYIGQIEMDCVDINSSHIRENIEDSQVLLPAVIFNYLNENKLYK
ncbi:nicotinate (nicotinamide) nucleotide adenylyltransferase [Marinicellulosiphila megalodicopiae]|uniref:nicotinate (nicotinamide) nucleotide adenylyltransferase n=1 Tax=Marinicellulosiphila megalodicopiae TaxID=2724896 RepID=UPI003BB06CA6